MRFSGRRPLDARSLSLLAATEQCAGGTDLVRHWLTIFDCCQPMCVGRRRRWTTIRLPARPRFALPEPAVPLPARGRATATETRVMVDPTGPSTLHTDPQAVWHLGRTRNEVNRANQTTLNLPDSVVVSHDVP